MKLALIFLIFWLVVFWAVDTLVIENALKFAVTTKLDITELKRQNALLAQGILALKAQRDMEQEYVRSFEE